MDVTFTDQQRELRRTVRELLDKNAATDAPALWALLCDQVGVAGLALAEEHGGAGATWVDLGIALEETGRALLAASLLTTTVAAAALEAAGDVALLPGLAAGTTLAALGVSDTAEDVLVSCGDVADVIVLATESGLRRAPAAEVVRESVVTLDQSRGAALVDGAASAWEQVGGADDAARAVDLLRVAIAIESAGAARRCLELTVDYLKTRVQFGVPIGTFQALQHRAADLAVQVEAATSTAYYAAWAAADAPEELPLVAPLAKATCCTAFLAVAGETIQMHGGIGFTWEHAAHRYFKRAKANDLALGGPSAARRLVATRSGLLR